MREGREDSLERENGEGGGPGRTQGGELQDSPHGLRTYGGRRLDTQVQFLLTSTS